MLLLTLFGCNSKPRESTPAHSPTLARLAEGDYLSRAYIGALKSKRSAFEAGETGQMNLVIVHREGTRFLLQPIFNFHESGTEFAIDQDGSVSSVDPESEYTRNPSATVMDDHTFTFGFGEFKPVTYEFVKSSSDYISRAVLVGKYHDKQGRADEFREDGWAVFPDRKFKFEIGTDHVLDAFDYFLENRKVWAFKRNGGQLQIFTTNDAEGFDQISSERPYLSLTEVR